MTQRLNDWMFPTAVLFAWTLATAYTLGLALV
jgi:hypothetical protein